MRILLLNQYFIPDSAATGQLLGDLAQGLRARGHEVHIICSTQAYGGGKVKISMNESIDGIFIHRLNACGFGRRNIVGQLTDYISFFILALIRALRLPRMDICMALTTPPFIGVVGMALKMLKGTRLALWNMDLYPHIAAVYGTCRQDGIIWRILIRLGRLMYRQASLIISLGEFMSQRLIEAGAIHETIVTVHNWVPGESVYPIGLEKSKIRRQWNPESYVTLMYSGNFGLGHSMETLIKVAKLLQDEENFRMLLVGTGKMRDHLVQMVEVMELHNIDFHEPQPLTELADSLASADIHLVSQQTGTQGLIVPSKLYGVMAAARPIIFIGPEDCESAQIIHNSEAGLIVSPDSPTSVTEAARILIRDKELRERMGRNARNYYVKHFGCQRSVSHITDSLEAILNKTFSAD